MFKRNSVFCFNPLYRIEGVRLTCCVQKDEHELFAFVIRSGDLIINKFISGSKPIVRWIPWFDDIKRKIKAMTFSPDARWLLTICADCSIFVLPCLSLLTGDNFLEDYNGPWCNSDIFNLPSPVSNQDFNPSSLAWWTRTPSEPDFRDIGILGSTIGNVVIFAISSGSTIINVKIEDAVSKISVFDQKPNACILLTNVCDQQWKLLLSEVQPTQIEVPKCSETRSSRLQGLKQLSVDTIASIKQRITEGRSKSVPVLQPVECPEGEAVCCAPQWQLNVMYERVTKNIISFIQKIIAVIYPANIVAIDNFNLHTNTVHKLPFTVSNFTVTNCLFIFTNVSKTKVYIASQEYSLCKSDPNKQILTDISNDSILEEIDLDTGEEVVDIHCLNSNETRCLIVTNHTIYFISLKDDPRKLALESVMSLETLHIAEKLSCVFRLDLQELICEAANIHIINGRSNEASQLYSMSKGGSMRNSVMLAVLGNVPEILVSLSNNQTANKIHFSNLKVLAFVHQYLTNYSDELHKNFTEMLNKGGYDEALAVSVLAQAGLCNDLLQMTKERGLQPVTVVALANILQHNYPLNVIHCSGFWDLISEYSFCEALLSKPKIAKIHFNFIQGKLSVLDIESLVNLENLYNPFRPSLLPWISGMCQGDVPLQMWIQLYLMIGIHISAIEDKVCLDFVRRKASNLEFLPVKDLSSSAQLIGAGHNHAVVLMNGNAYSWGNSAYGVLGCGPTVSRSCPPNIIETFPSIGTKVLSVSSGRNHSLALTDNGIYVWGSNKYGQLGVLGVVMSWFPTLVEFFCDKDVVQISAGQYHSLALTNNGTCYSWGWGVHGQLGHGNVENSKEPKIINLLEDKGIIYVLGGHAHSLFLDAGGQVWACGSSAFGQLGTGSNTKSSLPIQVFGLPEPIKDLATGYFHSVAVADGGRVYQWGCSPTVLRATAHAAKRKMRGQENGEVALEDGMSYLTPTLVDMSHVVGNVSQVSVGIEHSALLTEDGTVYTWGRNMDGQLGTSVTQKKANQTVLYPSPISIGGTTIREIGCGGDYTVAIDSTGKVWTWGANHHSPANRTALAALEGEVVVFKMKSRVIKLPHGTTTSNPLPTLLPVPTQYNELKKKIYKSLSVPLLTWKDRIHYAIETLDNFYQALPLLELSSALNECNLGSKIALVQSDITTSLDILIKSVDYKDIFLILDYYLPLAINLKKPLPSVIEVILSTWIIKALPVSSLENFLDKYFSDVATIVGFLLFKVNTDYAPLVSKLSTKFNLRLLDALLMKGEKNLECVLPGVESINDAIVAINLSDSFVDIDENNVYESVSCNSSSKFPDTNCSSSYNNRKPALYLK